MIDENQTFIQKHKPFITLLFIDLFTIISNLIVYGIVKKYNIINNIYFSWYFIIILIPALYFMLYAVMIKTKDNSLSFYEIISHFLLILFLIIFTFTLVFSNFNSHNYLADANGDRVSSTWLDPLYYSLTTLTTLGTGDVYPEGTYFKIFSMIEVLLGWMFFIIMFSNSFRKLKSSESNIDNK